MHADRYTGFVPRKRKTISQSASFDVSQRPAFEIIMHELDKRNTTPLSIQEEGDGTSGITLASHVNLEVGPGLTLAVHLLAE